MIDGGKAGVTNFTSSSDVTNSRPVQAADDFATSLFTITEQESTHVNYTTSSDNVETGQKENEKRSRVEEAKASVSILVMLLRYIRSK